MEFMMAKLVEMLTKKVGTYELNGMETEVEFDVPMEVGETLQSAHVKIDIKVESLKITVDNDSL